MTRRATTIGLLCVFAAGAIAAGASFASAGGPLWVSRYDGPASTEDRAVAVVLSPDGSRVFVTGSANGGHQQDDYGTVAYDAATGSQLWARLWTGAGTPPIDDPTAIAASGSVVVVTGSTAGGIGDPIPLAVAYDAATGMQLWAQFVRGGQGRGYGVAMSADGATVFVTGSLRVSFPQMQYKDYMTTIAYDARSGTQLWAAEPEGHPGSAVAVSPDGSTVFVAGESGGREVFAYSSSSGRKLWARRFDRAYTIPAALAVSADGSTLVAAGTAGDLDYNYLTAAYAASTGGVRWVRLYRAPANGNFAYGVAVSANGSKVFVTGGSVAARTGIDYETIAYDGSSGAVLWGRRYDGPAHQIDEAYAVALRPDGTQVFVTGRSAGEAGDYDYATLAYDASTGATLWRRRYDRGNGDDLAAGLQVSPDGSKVFVTGASYDPATNFDYATIAYSTG